MINQGFNPPFDPLLRTAFEHSPGGLLLIDREGLIVLANRGAERIFGYAGHEFFRLPVAKLIPGGDWTSLFTPEKDIAGNLKFFAGWAGTGLQGRTKDGSNFPVEIDMNRVETVEGSFIILSIADPRAAANKQNLLQAAIESAPSGMVIVDGSGAIVLVNRETERLFGYGREELLGQSIELLVPERFRSKHPQYRAAYSLSPSARLMGGGRDLFGLRKDGTEIPVEIGLNPILTSQGLFVLSVIVDISERKQAEEALRRSAEELKRSNAELEQFAYIASHDLQEPLRMITGFLQLLENRNPEQLDEKQKSYIDYAVNGAKRMSQLITDLLQYSRVQRKNRKVDNIDLNKALESAVFNLQRSIEESNAVITHDELPTISGDPMQLTQLFQNLIGNAIKFRRGGVLPEIIIDSRRNGHEWVVSVRDNGIGIDQQHRERIFMIFQRLHSQKEYPGTGIGLAICKKIVEHHGGRIWVESNSQGGSTFYCSFAT